MPRTLSRKIEVKDLEYVVEHVVRLAYSNVRAGEVEEEYSIVVEREIILEIALETERLKGLALDGNPGENFVARVDHCCDSLESVIKKTVNPVGMKKMRSAIRQKRHGNPSASSELVETYTRCKGEDSVG